jgi:hypothetical protein
MSLYAYGLHAGAVWASFRIFVIGDTVHAVLDMRPRKYSASPHQYTRVTWRARSLLEVHPLWGLMPFRVVRNFRRADGSIEDTFVCNLKPGAKWLR